MMLYASIVKGYQDNFEDVKYNAQAWLPGVDTLSLKPDGSVRTYGTWTGKNSTTGKEINLTGDIGIFNFDDEGKIITQRDFFDYGGMMQAVAPKNPVLVTLKVKPGGKTSNDRFTFPILLMAYKLQEILMVVYLLKHFLMTILIHIIIYGDWASYEHYQTFLH